METMQKEEAMKTFYLKDIGKVKDGSTTDEWDPWNPPYPTYVPPRGIDMATHLELGIKWMKEKEDAFAVSRATNIIIPDRIPQSVNDALHKALPQLVPILEKDSVRCFLRFFKQQPKGMACGLVITPEAFNQMIMHNGLQCANVALEGQAPELSGYRANPNYMNQYGYFPLHLAAELFSVNMIELLLHHGASANLCTAGDSIIEGLLPLHVAIENTCQHKYLEDSLLPDQVHQDYNEADAKYVFKLIYLLCLPEMKIFLDTTRLLAKYTDNLLDELWNYIKEGKLAQTAVLLLAAQEQIRLGTKFKNNCNSNPDGFAVISDRILDNTITLQLEMGQNGMEQGQVEAKIKLNHTTMMLVRVISRAGERLDSYIRAHLEVPYFMQVPHLEVLERVSSILRDYGFCPTHEGIDIGNLCPYDDVLAKHDIPRKPGEQIATKEALERDYLRADMGKAARKKQPRRWELKFARRSFFPWWRSVLSSRLSVKVYPKQARYESFEEFNCGSICCSSGGGQNSTSNI